MFSQKSTPLLQKQKLSFKSTLDKGCTIEGNLHISGNYLIAGQVVWDIFEIENSKFVLYIDKTAYVKGNVHCTNLVLVGKLEGNVIANGTVEVCAGSTIIGDIQSTKLHVDSNARINGKLICLNGQNIEEVMKDMIPGEVVKP